MNFFEEQKNAKRNTFYLMLLFFLAVSTVSILVGFLADNFFMYWASPQQGLDHPQLRIDFHSQVFRFGTLANFTLISLISGWRLYRLQNPEEIAEMVGGSVVLSGSDDLKEKQLLNVVEEISLASGVPIPLVYILRKDHSVNAFAAGWSPQHSVVAVTKGALEQLDRDEMQGVIAHEFSHILNGDMRLNIQMIGVVSGLVALTEIATKLLASERRGFFATSRPAKTVGPFVVFALPLLIIGSLGVFFARIIQAAVSRQREFLADASAVQFTRSAEGLSQALGKVLFSYGSKIESVNRHELAHLFFADGSESKFFFATHPDLTERIFKINPNFKTNDFLKENPRRAFVAEEEKGYELLKVQREKRGIVQNLAQQTAQETLRSIGQPQFLNMEVTKNIIEKIPLEFLQAARSADQAMSILLGLVLINQSEESKNMIKLTIQDDPQKLQLLNGIEQEFATSNRRRFALLQITLGTLKLLPVVEKEQLIASLKGIYESDNVWQFYEVVSFAYVADVLLGGSSSQAVKNWVKGPNSQLLGAQGAIEKLLWWVLSEVGNSDLAKKRYSELILQQFPKVTPVEQIPPATVADFKGSILLISQLESKAKQRVLELLWNSINTAHNPNSMQIECLRLVCSLIGAPVPAFLS